MLHYIFPICINKGGLGKFFYLTNISIYPGVFNGFEWFRSCSEEYFMVFQKIFFIRTFQFSVNKQQRVMCSSYIFLSFLKKTVTEFILSTLLVKKGKMATDSSIHSVLMASLPYQKIYEKAGQIGHYFKVSWSLKDRIYYKFISIFTDPPNLIRNDWYFQYRNIENKQCFKLNVLLTINRTYHLHSF